MGDVDLGLRSIASCRYGMQLVYITQTDRQTSVSLSTTNTQLFPPYDQERNNQAMGRDIELAEYIVERLKQADVKQVGPSSRVAPSFLLQLETAFSMEQLADSSL